MQLRVVVTASSSCDVKDDAGRVIGERKKDVKYGRKKGLKGETETL